jgi:hypothetical protein
LGESSTNWEHVDPFPAVGEEGEEWGDSVPDDAFAFPDGPEEPCEGQLGLEMTVQHSSVQQLEEKLIPTAHPHYGTKKRRLHGKQTSSAFTDITLPVAQYDQHLIVHTQNGITTARNDTPPPSTIPTSSHTKACMQDRRHEIVHISRGDWYEESKYTKIHREMGHGPGTVITHKKRKPDVDHKEDIFRNSKRVSHAGKSTFVVKVTPAQKPKKSRK